MLTSSPYVPEQTTDAERLNIGSALIENACCVKNLQKNIAQKVVLRE